MKTILPLFFVILTLFSTKTFSQCGEGLNLILTTQSEVNTFLNDYCDEFQGDLRFRIDSTNIDPITTLEPLLGLRILDGILEISNIQITNLDGLDSLNFIGSLRLYNNEELENIKGLKSLRTCRGDFHVSGNSSLLNFEGLQSLYYINTGGHLNIQHNDQLENIDHLYNLQQISGLLIQGNNSLTNLDGLDEISPYSINESPFDVSEVAIFDNPMLSTCDNQFICTVITREELTFQIENNAEGCNTLDEIEIACTTASEEDETLEETLIFPNPFQDHLTIVNPYYETIHIVNAVGALVKTIRMVYGENHLDLSDLDAGVYIIIFTNGTREKVIKI